MDNMQTVVVRLLYQDMMALKLTEMYRKNF